MSDLEEEDRCHSDWTQSAEWSDDQIGILMGCEADCLKQAGELYKAIQIPGELNTRVRAAIESDRRHRRQGFLRLFGAGAAVIAVIAGVCCIIFTEKSVETEGTEVSNQKIGKIEKKA